MLVLIALWLPYIVSYFPGCICVDAANQLLQYYGVAPLSGHHPIASTFLYGILIDVGRFFGSDAAGVLLCVAFQTAFLAYACVRIVVCVREMTRRSSCAILAVLLLCFAFVPIWGTAAAVVKKDTLFYACSSLMFVHGIELVLLVNAGGRFEESSSIARNLLPFCVFGLLSSAIRNDGFMLFLASSVCCFALSMVLSSDKRLLLGRFTLGVVIVSACYLIGYKTILMNSVNAEDGSIAESLTIPLQQTARFYIEAPDDVTSRINEGVSAVVDVEGLTKEVYNPLISDNIKDSFAREKITSDDLVRFVYSYFEMGIKHPRVFAEAFIDQTLGWWYPELLGKPDWAVGGLGLYRNYPEESLYAQVIDIDMPFYDSMIVQALNKAIGCFGYIPGIGLLVYPAIYFWALLIAAAYLWTRDRKREILLLIPLFFYFAICVASPVNGLTRYVVPIIMCMPLVLSWIVADPLGRMPNRSSADVSIPDSL